jgi:hypothetical protein
MKKIIVASESKRFTKMALEFVSTLQEQESLFVVGAFSHSLNYAELIENSTEPYRGLVVDLVEQDREAVDENIMLFEHYCQRYHIRYRVHEENCGFEIDKLVNESRFADLLIVNGKIFNNRPDHAKPKLNIRQTLHKAECPILLLPDNFSTFKKLAITYDGKKESMFALKQFCYLLPAFSNLPAEIVYLSDEERDDVPQIKFLKEYVSQNFDSLNICKIHIDPKKDLARWAAAKKDVLVIAGSYSRTGLFNSLTDSFIDPILNLQQLPVFITHP